MIRRLGMWIDVAFGPEMVAILEVFVLVVVEKKLFFLLRASVFCSVIMDCVF